MKRKTIIESAILIALLLCGSLYAQAGTPIRYCYDDLGRLTRVVDQNGNWAAYVYDAVGNILAIQRSSSPATGLQIFNFNPQRGGVGTAVIIQGQAFGATPSENQVRFNGVAAAIVSATATELVALVPTGATTGPISVTVGSSTATSSTNFTVVALPPEDTPPTVSIVSPTNGAVVLQGQPITIAINATGASAVSSVDISVNGVFLLTNLPAPFQATFIVPPSATSLTFGARAIDVNGNTGLAAPVTVSVAPDPLTNAQGTVVDSQGAVLSGASVALKLNGVKGEFYAFGGTLTAFPDLTGRTPDAVKRIAAFDYRNPDGLFGTDTFGVGGAISPNFAARFTGLLRINTAGSYTFTLGASGGATLKINNAVVASTPSQGYFAEATGTVTLASGDLPITVEYFTSSTVAELQLSFSQANLTGNQRQGLPPSMVMQTPDEFTTATTAEGAFSFTGVPTSLGDLRAVANITLTGTAYTGQATVPAVPGGVTDMGAIQVHPVTDGVARRWNNFGDRLYWGSQFSAAFNAPGDLSIGMWLLVPATGSTGGAPIRFGVSQINSSGFAFTYIETHQYALRLMGGPGAWDIQYFHMNTMSGGPPPFDNYGVRFDTNLPNDTWRYIGLTRVAATNTVTLYVGDGNTLTTYTGHYNEAIPGSGGLGLVTGMSFTDNRGFYGTIDEHYIWTRALSQSEHQAAMMGLPSATNLVLRAPIRGVSPEVDQSPTGATAYVQGTAVVPARTEP